MMKKRLVNMLGNHIFYKTLITLAVPIIIQNLLVQSVNVVDVLMIGTLGEEEIAAVSVSNQFFIVYQLIINGVAGGCSVFISQFWGANNKDNIKKVMGVGLSSAFVAGIICTIIPLVFAEGIIGIFSKDPIVIAFATKYLRIVSLSYIVTAITFIYSFAQRSIANPKVPMVISGVAILTNAALNYLLIFGKLGFPQLGVIGAAIGTVVARYIECALMVYISTREGSPFSGKIKEFMDFSFNFFKNVYKSIIPIALNELCWGLGFIMYTVAYGKIGTGALTGVQISNTIQNFFMVISFSVASASLVMIGNKIGEDNMEDAIKYSRHFGYLSIIIGGVLGVILIITAPYMLMIFNVSQEVRESAIILLQIFSLFACVRVFNVLMIIGVFRAGGDAGFALKIEGITMWFIGVPLAFFGAMVLKIPVYQVAFLITIEEVVKAVACILRLRSDKWINNITNGF